MEQEQPQHETKGRMGFYKGWRIVIISSLLQVMFGGLYQTGLSVYFLPLMRTFEISRTQLSFAFAVRSLEGGAEGPFAGYLVDRMGPRVIVIAGILIGGVGFVLLGLTQSYLTFLLVFLGILTVGFALPFHGLMGTINFWFRRRLGIAVSLASTGASIGGFLVTPIIAWIVLNHSWRLAAILSGVTIMVLGLPLAFMVRNPIGDEAASEEHSGGGAPRAQGLGGPAHPSRNADSASPATFDGDFTVKEALRTRAFWVLALAIGMRLMGQSALTVHFVPMLVSRDIGEGTATILLSVMAVGRLPAVVVGGLAADKWSRSRASAMAMVLGIATAGYITFGPTGLLTGIVFAILFAGAESCNTVTWAIVGEYFGRRNFASLRGIVMLLQSVMSFLSPVVAGFVYDATASYRIAFIAIGMAYFFSGLLYWFMRPPPAPKRAEESPAVAAPPAAR